MAQTVWQPLLILWLCTVVTWTYVVRKEWVGGQCPETGPTGEVFPCKVFCLPVPCLVADMSHARWLYVGADDSSDLLM